MTIKDGMYCIMDRFAHSAPSVLTENPIVSIVCYNENHNKTYPKRYILGRTVSYVWHSWLGRIQIVA
jgi:hypothetical protein